MSNTAVSSPVVESPILKRTRAVGGSLAVRAENLVVSAVLAFLDGFWRAVRWLGTTFIFGGLLVSVLISVATTGTTGLSNPSSWAIVQLILSYPEISIGVIGTCGFLTACGFLASLLRPAKPTKQEKELYVVQSVRAISPDDFVPSYQDVYLSRGRGQVDLQTQQALRQAALRKRDRGRKQEEPFGICIFGRPTEGKTRLAWETVRAVLPTWTLISWPHNGADRALRRQVFRRRRIIVWLDDMQKYDAAAIRELNDLPRRLKQAHARFTIVATCRDGADEVRVRQDFASMMAALTQFTLNNITVDEEKALSAALASADVTVDTGNFDGSPGSLVLGLTEMRRTYQELRDDPKLILRGIKLLRSIGIFDYPPLHVLAGAGTLGLFENRWIDARDTLVQKRFIRLGARDESGQPSLEPIADVYVDDAVVFDFPVKGSLLADLWPLLEEQFVERRDGAGLLALGATYQRRAESVDPGTMDEVPGTVHDTALAHARRCYTEGLGCIRKEVDASTWARLNASLGIMLMREEERMTLGEHASREVRVNMLEEAAKCFRQALLVAEEFYPEGERVETNTGLISTLSLLRRLTQSNTRIPERLKEEIQAHTDTLRVISRDADPVTWANTWRDLGIDYRQLAELEPGQKAARLDAAKVAYSKALTVHTRDEDPLEWAKLQLLLGNANWRRADGAHQATRDRVLTEALTAYNNALTVFSPTATPVEWTEAQFELARLSLRRAVVLEGAGKPGVDAEVRRGMDSITAAFTLLNQETFPDIYGEAKRVYADLSARLTRQN